MPKLSAKDRPKHPASATNARTKKITVLHGGGSRHIMRSPFDMRTAIGQWAAKAEGELVSHLGGSDAVTPTVRPLVTAFVRTQILIAVAQQELLSKPMFAVDGATAPAFDALLRAQDKLKALAETLGLERVTRDVTLRDIVDGRAELPERADDGND